MSSDEFDREIEQWAQEVVLQSRALVPCDFHMHVLLRRGGEDAEDRAYAIAQAAVRDRLVSYQQKKALDAVKCALELGVASCGHCESGRRKDKD